MPDVVVFPSMSEQLRAIQRSPEGNPAWSDGFHGVMEKRLLEALPGLLGPARTSRRHGVNPFGIAFIVGEEKQELFSITSVAADHVLDLAKDRALRIRQLSPGMIAAAQNGPQVTASQARKLLDMSLVCAIQRDPEIPEKVRSWMSPATLPVVLFVFDRGSGIGRTGSMPGFSLPLQGRDRAMVH